MPQIREERSLKDLGFNMQHNDSADMIVGEVNAQMCWTYLTVTSEIGGCLVSEPRS